MSRSNTLKIVAIYNSNEKFRCTVQFTTLHFLSAGLSDYC